MAENGRRQFVKYNFFKVDPQWRRLDHKVKTKQAKTQIETVRKRIGIGPNGAKALKALPGCAKLRDADLENLKRMVCTLYLN